MKLHKRLTLTIAGSIVACSVLILILTNSSGPVIQIDQGPRQVLGKFGPSQTFYNLTGKVWDPNGVFKLSYSIDGSTPRSLSIGPDTRRLVEKGSFNADIPAFELKEGRNLITLKAHDWLGKSSETTVEVFWREEGLNALPTVVEWSKCDSISEVAQIVDGPWTVENGSLKQLTLSYDRLVAVGSAAWSDYEILTSFRILAIDHQAFDSPVSARPALGIILRWQGHSDWGTRLRGRIEALIKGKWQPFVGWTPWGGGLWCDFERDETARPSLITDWPEKHFPPQELIAVLDKKYMVRLLVSSELNGKGAKYAFKLWPSDQPEPKTWSVQDVDKEEPLKNGSILLLAHHLTAEFGDLEIRPILPQNK